MIGHNIKFDGNFLMYHFGIEMRGIYDTMVVEKILQGKIYFAKDPVKPKKEETEEETAAREAENAKREEFNELLRTQS